MHLKKTVARATVPSIATTTLVVATAIATATTTTIKALVKVA